MPALLIRENRLSAGSCNLYSLIEKKVGNHLGKKATIFGGIILIGIGVEIFVKGVFF